MQALEKQQSLSQPLHDAATSEFRTVHVTALITTSGASRKDEFAKPKSSTCESAKTKAVAASFPADAHSDLSHSKKYARDLA